MMTSDEMCKFDSHQYRGVIISAGNATIDNITLSIIISAPKFRAFIDRLLDNGEIDVKSIRVVSVDFFQAPGTKPDSDKLGFIKVDAVAYDKRNGRQLNSITFVRGGAVAILIHVMVEGESYYLVVKQMRFPVGGARCEIVAGMIDAETHNFYGVVANEVKEETGLEIKTTELIPLGRIEPSAGACDEFIEMYAWSTSITAEQLQKMQETSYGKQEENESIQLLFWKDDENIIHSIRASMDPVLECAFYRYQSYLHGQLRSPGKKARRVST